MTLINIPILQDNYVWLLQDNHHTIIIDPGVAQPIIDYLERDQRLPTAILLTHHHGDHTDGVKQLLNAFPNLVVYGPEETRVKGATQIVKEGDILSFGSIKFTTIAVPGHTLGHLAYHSAPYLFCGDVLFSAGCGRIFEGTPEQMYASLMKLAALPDDTYVCSAHEYTLSNLNFAHHTFAEDAEIAGYLLKVQSLRRENRPTLPSRLNQEKKINLFLRCHEPLVKQTVMTDASNPSDMEVFRLLRHKKDRF